MARDAGALEVHFCSAAPPVCYPNVYGIDLPDSSALIARQGASISTQLNEVVSSHSTEAVISNCEIAEKTVATAIGADCVIFQQLSDLEAAVRECSPEILKDARFDASCFTGEYVTGTIDTSYLENLRETFITQQSEAARKLVDGRTATVIDMI